MTARSNRADVRNPLVALPAAAALLEQLEARPADREAFRKLFREISSTCHANADKAWATRKAPLAAYWRAQAVYARHIAVILNRERIQP